MLSIRTIFKITIPSAAIAIGLCFIAAKENKPSYPINNVPFTSVKVAPETFWGDRIRQSRKVTIHFDMESRIVMAHRQVTEDRGK